MAGPTGAARTVGLREEVGHNPGGNAVCMFSLESQIYQNIRILKQEKRSLDGF